MSKDIRYREVALSNGGVALVDAADYDRVAKHGWYAEHHDRGRVYAATYIKRKRVRLHRFILNPATGVRVDHVNRNGLDNRSANLRLVNASQNADNSPARGGSSRYKGVRWFKGKWTAEITHEYVRYYIGRFASEIDAAKAYNAKALELKGGYAWLNPV